MSLSMRDFGGQAVLTLKEFGVYLVDKQHPYNTLRTGDTVVTNETNNPQDNPSSEATPTNLTKHEFGKRLYRLMIGKGWTQSELSRRANIKRDNVSKYIRGVSLPGRTNVIALANALGAQPDDLLPDQAITAMDAENPSFEMKVLSEDMTKTRLRVNRIVSIDSALKIAEILKNDEAANTEGSGGAPALQRDEGETSQT